MKSEEIIPEIDKAKHLKLGYVGDDDFYIMLLAFETELLACHVRDINLSFSKKNELVENILSLSNLLAVTNKSSAAKVFHHPPT